MERLDKIRNLDDLIHQEFKKYFLKTMKSNFSKDYPKTFYISNLFTTSTNFIKNSVFDCAESDDLFGVKILFRSLIEHFLRFQYVNFNWMKTKSDETSKKYIDYTKAREILDQLKASITEHQLSNPKYTIASWQKIFEEIPDLKNILKEKLNKRL